MTHMLASLFTLRTWPLIGGLASLGILLSAFGFEYIGGYLPCAMCYTHRWIHGATIALGLGFFAASQLHTALARYARAVCAGMGVIFFAGFIYATRHAGIEYKWWKGPEGCTGGHGGETLTLADLGASLDRVQHIPLCDEAVWHFLGLSMAGWNALISLGLAAISGYIVWRNR